MKPIEHVAFWRDSELEGIEICRVFGMRFSVQRIRPWSVMWLRMAIVLTVILPFAGRLKVGTYRKGDWRLLVPMVLFQPCLYFLLESHALKFTTSPQASIFINLVPVTAVAFGWLAMGESLSGLQCIAAAGVVAGVAIRQP